MNICFYIDLPFLLKTDGENVTKRFYMGNNTVNMLQIIKILV